MTIHWFSKMWEGHVHWYGFVETEAGFVVAGEVVASEPARLWFGSDPTPYRYGIGKGWPGKFANSVDEAMTFVRWEVEEWLQPSAPCAENRWQAEPPGVE
jgi:hypothetical protein